MTFSIIAMLALSFLFSILLNLPIGVEAKKVQLEIVNISIQPAYHAIPIYAAQQFGWFEELGLKVNLSIFPSGAIQVKAAVNDKAWDLGIAGSVPNVIAGSQGILTIGISNDESYTTEVIGAPGISEWPPTTLYDGIFAGTPKSTGELLLRKCLTLAGVDVDYNHILFGQQGEIIEKLSRSSSSEEELPRYASLWAPNTYTYSESQPTSKVFCSGKDVDFPILGGLMVRKEYGKNNEETVKKVLAAYLRGITFMQNNEIIDDVIKISNEYHEFSGTKLSEAALREDLFFRPLFNLDEQLDLLHRNFANNYISNADKHYYELEDFLFDQGVIDTLYEPKEYVTDTYMDLVSKDPILRAYSYYGTGVISTTNELDNSNNNDKLKSDSIIGVIFGVIGVLCLALAFYILSNDKPKNDDDDEYLETM